MLECKWFYRDARETTSIPSLIPADPWGTKRFPERHIVKETRIKHTGLENKDSTFHCAPEETLAGIQMRKIYSTNLLHASVHKENRGLLPQKDLHNTDCNGVNHACAVWNKTQSPWAQIVCVQATYSDLILPACRRPPNSPYLETGIQLSTDTSTSCACSESGPGWRCSVEVQ